MNLASPLHAFSRLAYTLFLRVRLWLPRTRCLVFGQSDSNRARIGRIYAINLDRQPRRWFDLHRELDRIYDENGNSLTDWLVRFSAIDAQAETESSVDRAEIDAEYTLAEQLFVEPQPIASPDDFELSAPIQMTRAEVAIARSHIAVWRKIATSNEAFSMVLEDDVWIERGFAQRLGRSWNELTKADSSGPDFDILYVSYEEVRHGAPKALISDNVFHPERGLWFLSGYVLSRSGARKLLEHLPCRGPVDLWINHKFCNLKVRALRRAAIHQRRDLHSTNSYSILPTLSRIGVIDAADASLFHRRPKHFPVFAFGDSGTWSSSLAMALSMLGYRCCSDVDGIPDVEHEALIAGSKNRTFDAYVNVLPLRPMTEALARIYPEAKFIFLSEGMDRHDAATAPELEAAGVLRILSRPPNGWTAICEYLRLAQPDAPYPMVSGLGRREVIPSEHLSVISRNLPHDPSPWVVAPTEAWSGISISERGRRHSRAVVSHICDDFVDLDGETWTPRNDTFPGNLGLFRPKNVVLREPRGLMLSVAVQALGVRGLSAAAVSSRKRFLFGRFETTLKASNVPGIVTGFFLHRNSPRQEIDVEILGRTPTQMLVNVFYNPGTEGAKFDFGYRGTPALIDLGFDASLAPHRFTIEWDPCEIRWSVDGKLVHRRAMWNPTPIPHLPMTLHVNTWPSGSKELAGKLSFDRLPAQTFVQQIVVETHDSISDPCAFPGDWGIELAPA